MTQHEPKRYLSTGEVAERVGVKPDTIHAYVTRGQMPAPDAVIGRLKGWLPETIDAWNANRPSRFYAREVVNGDHVDA